eukprot:TRINITY_DN36776_c0_g1_i1.p1 TRINITY_DN36776_c0_g1~~TRINITY_DN36776_c0_g1_i1.p1  ORF type:complete len:330 (+),score=35.85 TRINITY_DN36776_c0_g1_i1:37-990(+)
MERGVCCGCKQVQVLGKTSESTGRFFCAGCWDSVSSDSDPVVRTDERCGRQTHVLRVPPPRLADADRGELRFDDIEIDGCPVVTVVSDPDSVYFNSVAQRLWQAARRMISYFVGQDLRGKQVLELGSGTGAVGIALSKMGAEVTLTDLPWVVPLLRYNIQANFEPDDETPATAPLQWGVAEHVEALPGTRYDMIIGSDITYYSPDFKALLDTMRLLHARSGASTRIILTQTRREDSVDEFRRACQRGGWGYEVVGEPKLSCAETLMSAQSMVIALEPPTTPTSPARSRFSFSPYGDGGSVAKGRVGRPAGGVDPVRA